MKPTQATALALAVLLIACTTAPARVIVIDPVSRRVALSDAVVTGKVTKFEDKNIKIGDEEYRVAVVKVEQGLRGADGLTHVRVAVNPSGYPRLEEGKEFLLFLAQPRGQTVFTLPGYQWSVEKRESGKYYDDQLKDATHCAKLLARADEGLKSKDPEERLLTAIMLLTDYRAPREGRRNEEPIDAAQSKLILEILAEAKWDGGQREETYRMTPHVAFQLLKLTEEDGWAKKEPRDLNDYQETAKKWLRDHAATYRIKKYVPEK